MIKGILILNTSGKVRLVRVYDENVKLILFLKSIITDLTNRVLQHKRQ